MSRVLFIRVSAETFNEDDVLKSWPTLCATVWPDAGANKNDKPSRIIKQLAPSPAKGALALVDAFTEHVRFVADEAERKALLPYAEKLEGLRKNLDEALGNRDVHKASTLTDAIEDALDEAEKAARF